MKNPFRFSILPYFTMGAGGIGLCLRLWLFSATDEKGLLPVSHPADAMLYILTALVLGILFIACRKPSHSPFSSNVRRFAEAGASLLGGVGLLLTALMHFLDASVKLAGMGSVACAVGGLLLLLSAFLHLRKKALPFWILAIVTVALMLQTVASCQTWGTVSQLQEYFFPLMASVFLILTAYYRTAMAARMGKRTKLAFFSQGALFFCCLALNSSNWALYFGMLFWAAAQIFSCYLPRKEA